MCIMSNDFKKNFKERRNNALKGSLIDIALLLLPIIIIMLLLNLTLIGVFIPLLLLYFSLPMFYTIVKRLTFKVTRIGKKDFSFSDGYKAFFKGSVGGIFGVISTLFFTVALILIFSLILSPAFDAIFNLYPEAVNFINAYNEMTTVSELINLIQTSASALTKPFIIIVGIIAFIPSLYLYFFAFNNNLIHHHICSIVLPDIDKNLSASQARALSRASFSKVIISKVYANAFKTSWPYLLAYIILYGLSLYGMTFANTDNTYVMFLLVMVTPSLSALYGFILNYFVLLNELSIVEELKDDLLNDMPEQLKVSIYQTYCNPSYIHGEESSARGCFVPAPNYQKEQQTYTAYQQPKEKEADTEKKDENYEDPQGVVIDLSEKKESDDK